MRVTDQELLDSQCPIGPTSIQTKGKRLGVTYFDVSGQQVDDGRFYGGGPQLEWAAFIEDNRHYVCRDRHNRNKIVDRETFERFLSMLKEGCLFDAQEMISRAPPVSVGRKGK